jgi:hypothetical protein
MHVFQHQSTTPLIPCIFPRSAVSPNVPDSFTYTPMCASDPALCPGFFVFMWFPKACRRILRPFRYLDIPYFQRYESRWHLVSADHTVAGGNVNVSDEDGDTPLYTVENIETARILVDNGADLMRRNQEGLTVCQALIIRAPS